MRRSALLLALTLAAAFATPAAAKAPVFKTGTFTGTASVGGAVKIKIYRGTCRKAFLNSIEVKGFCFDVKRFPVLTSPCPDGQMLKSRSFTSGFGELVVALKKKGKHSSQLVTGSSGLGNATVARRTFKLKAKGSKITGTATWQDTTSYTVDDPPGHDESDALNCKKTVATFTARR